MYKIAEQKNTKFIKTIPEEGKIYSGTLKRMKEDLIITTGFKFYPTQDEIIMLIPKEETNLFDKEHRQYAWFKCRICGTLAYGRVKEAQNGKNYNPHLCWKKRACSETGKKTGKENVKHLIEYSKSEKGRKKSSELGKIYGAQNILKAQEWCKEHPEHFSKIGKKNWPYLVAGNKRWREENPEKVKYYQQKATQAANQWRKDNPEEWKKVCAQNASKRKKCSLGEKEVIKFCEENNIPFRSEVELPELLGPKGFPRRLDFILNLPQGKIAIEVMGAQHYEEDHFFNKNHRNGDLNNLEVDKLKREYCEEHHIPLYEVDARKISTIQSQLKEILNEIEKR